MTEFRALLMSFQTIACGADYGCVTHLILTGFCNLIEETKESDCSASVYCSTFVACNAMQKHAMQNVHGIIRMVTTSGFTVVLHDYVSCKAGIVMLTDTRLTTSRRSVNNSKIHFCLHHWEQLLVHD